MRLVILLSTLTMTGFLAGCASAQAQSHESASSQSVTDCTNLTLDGRGDDELTKEERIKKLEGTLYDSVDRYDTCLGQAIAAGGGGGAGGGAGAGTGNQGEGSGSGGSASTTEEPVTEVPPQEQDIPETEASGNVPKDIPPADNDSVLQRQIRELAMKEKDPKKREELWDLYRKYKK
ncbi:hypothetical protein EYS14_17835 [Alteromonadaceae bacterium M269]|nr:hypothetical protein EYS14_17835 [Alteromonadaceae bacterium M269]